MPENELKALDVIIQEHEYSGEFLVSHAVRIIQRLCQMTFVDAKGLLDKYSRDENYQSMDWFGFRQEATKRASKSAKFNWSVQNLDKNWSMLGYESFDEAIKELRSRFDLTEK